MVACLVVTPGSLVATASYGFYLRSDAYRRSVEADLAEQLGMSVSIGGVRPLTLRSRALRDVRVAMVNPKTEVFACRRAVWRAMRSADGPRYTLDLIDGRLLVGTAEWSRAEYDSLLAGGLGHDFAALGVREVRVADLDLRFQHSMAEFLAGGASGVVRFDEEGVGRATLNCGHLNGFTVAEPVRISARFTPGERLMFHELTLTVPKLPLSVVGLVELGRREDVPGSFEGRITYRQGRDGATVDFKGSIHDADLANFTRSMRGGPMHGVVSLDVESATLHGQRLTGLVAHGTVGELELGELIPALAGPDAAARLDLTIDELRWRDGRVASLRASGRCGKVSLDGLLSLIGPGRMTGHATAVIHSLVVENDSLRAADVDLLAVAPQDGPGLIDRALLARAARAVSGFDITAALPPQIEYSQLGARLKIEGDQLRVLGSHGPKGQTILTIKLLGRDWAIVKQPPWALTVPDLWPLLREQAGKVDPQSVERWWEALRKSVPEER